jgi:hypothetical protein
MLFTGRILFFININRMLIARELTMMTRHELGSRLLGRSGQT